jgi:hypothetical protein
VVLGLTGQERQARRHVEERLDGGWIFGWRVRARPVVNWVVFFVVESSFARSFQWQRMCHDRSSVAREPRVATSLFSDESASWQRRQPDF